MMGNPRHNCVLQRLFWVRVFISYDTCVVTDTHRYTRQIGAVVGKFFA